MFVQSHPPCRLEDLQGKKQLTVIPCVLNAGNDNRYAFVAPNKVAPFCETGEKYHLRSVDIWSLL